MTKPIRVTQRVLLVGLSGVNWSTLRQPVGGGGLPTLAALLRSGLSGQLAAVAPRCESSTWTSLITGKRPHKHGILHDTEPQPDGLGNRSVSRPLVQTATLGTILSAAERTVHQVGWPVSHPVEQLRGVAVSDQFARAGQIDSLHRAGGWPWVTPHAAAKEIFGRRCLPRDVEEVALAQLVPERLIPQPCLGPLQQVSRAVMAESLTLFRAAKWCMQASDWDCTLCAFPAIAKLQDAMRQTLPPDRVADFAETIVSGCYEHLDMLLGQLIAAAGEEATVILVGLDGGGGCKLVLQSPGLNSVRLPPTASVLDVTPTVLRLLGVPPAEDLDGRAWPTVLGTDHEHPTVATWDTCIHPPGEPNEASADQAARTDEAVQHLVELGYVDPVETAAREKADRCRRETRRNRALSLLDAGEIDSAIEQLQAIKADAPDWTAPYELLAETYLQRNELGLAEQELEFLIHHGAESARLYLTLGRIAAAKRTIDEALERYHVAGRIMADLRGLQVARGAALLRHRDFESAFEAFQTALQSDGASASLFDALATCSLGLSRFEQAVEFALAAIEQDIRFAPAHYHLALALVGLGRMADARQTFEAAAAVDPEFLAPLRQLAQLSHASPAEADGYRSRGREIIRRRRQLRRAADT